MYTVTIALLEIAMREPALVIKFSLLMGNAALTMVCAHAQVSGVDAVTCREPVATGMPIVVLVTACLEIAQSKTRSLRAFPALGFPTLLETPPMAPVVAQMPLHAMSCLATAATKMADVEACPLTAALDGKLTFYDTSVWNIELC